MIIGPPGYGKTQLAKYLSKEYRRGNVNLGNLIEWNK